MSANKPVIAIQKGDKRFDENGEIRCMTHADGYVMYRRPRCKPSIMSEKRWLSLSATPIIEETK